MDRTSLQQLLRSRGSGGGNRWGLPCISSDTLRTKSVESKSGFEIGEVLPKLQRPAALYAQIAAHLREKILTGVLKEGDKIPSIKELGKAFEVDTRTANRAFDLLAKEGLIRTEHRKGTYVQPRSEWRLKN